MRQETDRCCLYRRRLMPRSGSSISAVEKASLINIAMKIFHQVVDVDGDAIRGDEEACACYNLRYLLRCLLGISIQALL
jgi:hypothetical protein